MRWSRLLTSLSLLLGCGGDAGSAPEPEPAERHTSWRRLRLLVADEARQLHVYDAGERAVVNTFPAPIEGELRATASGRHAVLTGLGEAYFVKAGVTFFAHDDHYDLVKSAARVATFSARAAATGDVLSNRGWITVAEPALEAGPARLLAIREDTLNFDEPQLRTLLEDPTDAGHAMALGAGFLQISAQGEIAWLEGEQRTELGECSAPRAFSVYDSRALFECQPGQLAWVSGTPPTLHTLTVPANVLRIELHPLRDSAEVLFEGSRVASVTTQGTGELRALPEGTCDAALEPSSGASWLTLDGTGALRSIDVASGEPSAPLAVTAAFSCDEVIRPRLALAPERAYVSDPSQRRVHDVDTRAMQVAEPIAIEGRPTQIVVLGIDRGDANASTVAAH